MSFQDVLAPLESVTRLLPVLVWHVLVILVPLRFEPEAGDFLCDLADFSLQGRGL